MWKEFRAGREEGTKRQRKKGYLITPWTTMFNEFVGLASSLRENLARKKKRSGFLRTTNHSMTNKKNNYNEGAEKITIFKVSSIYQVFYAYFVTNQILENKKFNGLLK